MLAVLGPTQYVATAIVAATYLLFVLVTRQQVMWSSYEALRAYIEGVRVAFEDAGPELERIFKKAGTQRWQRWPLRLFTGLSDARILAGWRVARTVELAHVPKLSIEETTSRLRSLAATLSGEEHPARRETAARIRKLVDPPKPEREPSKAELHALLQEAMRQEFDTRDTLYESLALENQRATWLGVYRTRIRDGAHFGSRSPRALRCRRSRRAP